MQKDIQTYEIRTSPSGGDGLQYSPADSPANLFRKQENVGEPMMNATYGRQCWEQSAKSGRAGWWAKTFTALLIGMPGWFSTRCALTWKTKATKSNRSYCQLAVSMPRTSGTGRSLLPTPTTQEVVHPGAELSPTGRRIAGNGATHSLGLADTVNMIYGTLLPTPNASEGTKYARTYNPKSQMGKGLATMAVNGMLPTPEANNYKNGHRKISPRIERKIKQGWTVGLNDLATLGILPDTEHLPAGSISQLNPQFVGQMMGFSSGWMLKPFLKASAPPGGLKPSTVGASSP